MAKPFKVLEANMTPERRARIRARTEALLQAMPRDTRREDLLTRYCELALHRATLREFGEGAWFADLPGFDGVWAEGGSPQACRETLGEVLREWIILKLGDRDRDLPIVDDIDLTVLI